MRLEPPSETTGLVFDFIRLLCRGVATRSSVLRDTTIHGWPLSKTWALQICLVPFQKGLLRNPKKQEKEHSQNAI